MTPKDKSINVGKSAMPGGARPVFEAAEVTDPDSDELEDPSESEEDSEREVVVGSKQTALANSWLSKATSAASNLSRPLTALLAATEIANRGCRSSATIWRIADVIGFSILDLNDKTSLFKI